MIIRIFFVITLGLLLAGCSKQSTTEKDTLSGKTNTLGIVDLSDQSPRRYDLGDGKACTITPKSIESDVYEVSVAFETTDASGKKTAVPGTPRARPLPGQQVTLSVGDNTVSFTPKFK